MRAFMLFALLLVLLIPPAIPALAADAPEFPPTIQSEVAAAKESMLGDQAAALRHAVQIDAQGRALADPRTRALALATARWLAAEAHLRSNAPAKAAPLLIDGLRLVAPITEPIKLRGDLLMSQGALFMNRNQVVDALNNYQAAFRIFGAVDEPRSQAVALQNIGTLYSAANDDGRAEQYFRQAAELYGDDPILSFTLHNNRANVLMTLGRFPEASKEYEAALNLARDMQKPLLEARMLSNLARAQASLKQVEPAQRSLDRAFRLIQGMDDPGLKSALLATGARLAADRGDYVAALRLIRECFAGRDLKKTTNEFRYAHLYAYDIYTKVGDSRQALAHLEAVRRLTDEATKVATTTGAALMAARFNYAQQQNKILSLQNEEQARKARFQRSLFLLAGGATLIVMAALAWGLVTIHRSRSKVRAANIVLGKTNAELEKALQARTEFLATTSHEIRTPLNGILGMTQVMLADPALAAPTRERLGIVRDAGVTIRALVDDILDMAKMETGNMSVEAEPMDLCAVLADVTRLWEEQARAKGLGFRRELSHAPHWIVGDAARLRQVVFNLLSNAIKFTERGGVTIRALDEGEGEARRLRIVIADSGIGIPPAKLDEVFESFRQVDASTTRRFGGSGLGLAICRNLARAMGGDITVASELGKGSTFTLDLPLVPAEAPAVVVETRLEGRNMVILDRNPIARSMLRTLFEPHAATLRFVASSEEAEPLLRSGDVTDLIADEMSLKAGETGPFAALRHLRAAAREARIAVLWAAPDAETRSELIDAGAQAVVEKPIGGAALVDAIIPPAEEKTDGDGGDPLVSRAA